MGDVAAQTEILEPIQFPSDHWSLIERMRANFNDREAHTLLPMPIARFRKAATKTIYEHSKEFNNVETIYVDDSWLVENTINGTPDTMTNYVRLYNDDVDAMMSVLVPSARYRKVRRILKQHNTSPPGRLMVDYIRLFFRGNTSSHKGQRRIGAVVVRQGELEDNPFDPQQPP